MSKKTKPAVQPQPQADLPKPENTPEATGQIEASNAETTVEDQEKPVTEAPADDQAKADTEAPANDQAKAFTEAEAHEIENLIEHLRIIGEAVQNAHAMLARAREVFAMYPELQECHFSADGTAFTEKQHAVMHAQNLETQQVFTIKRSEV